MSATDSEQSITRLIGLARAGDPTAAEGLWAAYFEKLVGVARARLGPARAADQEDVALSAFASFWEGARRDRFPQLTDRTALWPLLVAITAHKCTDLVRRETRQKRGGGATADPTALEHLIDSDPPPDFALQVADQLQHLLAKLDATGDATLRQVAALRLSGLNQSEIAERLGCVRETVGRKLKLIEACWAEGAGDDL
jgi:RNA polymerase sigma factor (sigma-70 family)